MSDFQPAKSGNQSSEIELLFLVSLEGFICFSLAGNDRFKVHVTFHRSLVTKPLRMLNLGIVRPKPKLANLKALGCVSIGKQ